MATKPFFGNPGANAPTWSKYATLLGALTADIPETNDPFTLNDPGAGTPVEGQWDPVGALDDGTPFDNGSESITSTDHTAAGFGVYGTTYKNQKETRSFTMKESTLVTLGILYDTSDVTDTAGTLSGTLKRRDPSEKFLVAFHRQNTTECERYISKNFAYIDSISRAFSNDESMCTVTVVIVPTENDELYAYYKGPKA